MARQGTSASVALALVAAAMLLVAAMSGTALGSTSSTSSVPQVVTFEGAPYHGKGLAVRPKTILMSGDGSEFLAGHGQAGRHPRVGRLHWTAWGAIGAKAWGAWWIDNCTPDCVGGRRIPYRINLEVSQPEVEQGHDLFTRMTVTFLSKRPVSPYKQTQVFKLRRQSSTFSWG